MTDKQRKNLEKMLQETIIGESMVQSIIEENMMKAVQETAHLTRMIYDAYLHEGFSDEQAMFLTTSTIENALMAGGRE